ncbi:MAG: HlyD family efflux transporter periplasmic adaptor subunit [Planctomycetes bacterium]|nr:HlyD family efflux transporter periplasmic adaptor subunit [Planctomycetota bacterium]
MATKDRWLPLLKQSQIADKGEEEAGGHEGHDHGGHDDAHEGHEDSSSLHLSKQARRNIGLTEDKLQPIKLGAFTRTLNVPARVVEQPGRTRVQVASPMTGVVAAVYVVQGEAVQPGTLLFKVRLTHEDLVQAQAAFLKTLGELDVEDREIARLSDLGASGVIAGKTLLARKYSKQKLEAVLNANRESLLLHGLSSSQIASIIRDRRLLRELEVRAPALPSHEPVVALAGKQANAKAEYICPMLCTPATTGPGRCPVCAMGLVSAVSGADNTIPSIGKAEATHLFTVQTINVNMGSMISAGDAMAVLADLDELYVEGRAFEHDADEITHASRKQAAGESGWEITAVLESNDKKTGTVGGLKIVYIDNEIESDSRAQLFYVDLPNQILQDTQTPEGHRFLTWRFKPGQRMQLRVPIEQWKDRIVLPVEAVAKEGAETFVFLENGDHFDQRPVHVEYQDQLWVVIANDGSLFPGDTVALTGAHQMQVALKNKAGGGVDPHAGHNH